MLFISSSNFLFLCFSCYDKNIKIKIKSKQNGAREQKKTKIIILQKKYIFVFKYKK